MAKDDLNSLHGLDEDVALRTILEGTATETGELFFSALVEHLMQALNTHSAWVTEYIEETRRLRALAFCLGGQWVEDYEYDIAGTPCEDVIEECRVLHVPENALELYPNDADMQKIGAVSYLGAPMQDTDGGLLGHLAVMDTRPMPEEPRGLALIQIFANRAAAELRRSRAESQVREREEKLSRLVDGAMDAIIELDQNLTVTMINSAAEKSFKCGADQMVGQKLTRFFSDECAEELATLVTELDARPEGKRYLWIPGMLDAKCIGGDQFQAEATLSQFAMHGHAFYTLILRNVDERLEAEQKIRRLTIESESLREEIEALRAFDGIVGESEPLLKVLRDVEQVAKSDATVLILGETGTGKEVIVRAIHAAGSRCHKALVKVNCPVIPATLIESELFGHEKGAFTGATAKRNGRFALADGGSIFLDEIGELPLDLQAKLLRVLQEGEFEPVGSSHTRKVDVRVLAATNRDLEQSVKDGTFREDLYYRLNVFPITLPPLRERGDDIAALASAFMKKLAQRMGRTVEPLSEESTRRLKSYSWPGNVRELQNVIERALITSEGDRINPDRMLPEIDQGVVHAAASSPEEADNRVLTVEEFERMERKNLILALAATDWRVAGKTGAARLLGMNPSTLSSRLKTLGIKRPRRA